MNRKYKRIRCGLLYDGVTEKAVRDFQAAHNLKVDGVCGNQTLSVLFGY